MEAPPPDDPIARINSFFSKRRVGNSCPVCTNQTWVLVTTMVASQATLLGLVFAVLKFLAH
jgi:hypothetical protein